MMSERHIIYEPPTAESIRRFAREVGAHLAQGLNDVRYADPAVIDGLAAFLKTVGDILAKRLNAQSGANA